jgi:hypothetical protein
MKKFFLFRYSPVLYTGIVLLIMLVGAGYYDHRYGVPPFFKEEQNKSQPQKKEDQSKSVVSSKTVSDTGKFGCGHPECTVPVSEDDAAAK